MLTGIIPALHTAFDDAGELDLERQGALVERLIGEGVHGLFVAGTTGEFGLLSTGERERLLEGVLRAARGRVPVVAHVGALDPRDAFQLAAHAAGAGAAAVACVPPFYHRVPEAEVLEHFRRVAAAARPLPFYAYHIPELTGVAMTARLLEGLLAIPGFAGLKWSDPDLFALARAADLLGDRAQVLAGRDEILLPALTLGARGAVGSTYNFLAPAFVGLWNDFLRNDLAAARARQAAANRAIAVVLARNDPPSAGKEATRWAGSDCGLPRPPLKRYDEEERRRLERELAAAGLPRGGAGSG